MKTSHFLGILLLAIGSTSGKLAGQDQPELIAGVPLKDGQNVLQVDGTAALCVVDWNADGRKDLLVGQQLEGYTRIYLN